MEIYQIIDFSEKKLLSPPRYKISNVVNQPSGRWQVSLENDAISRALQHSLRLEIQVLSQPCWEEVSVVEPTQNCHPCHHGQHLWAHLANSRMAKERGKGGGDVGRVVVMVVFKSLLKDIKVRLSGLLTPEVHPHNSSPKLLVLFLPSHWLIDQVMVHGPEISMWRYLGLLHYRKSWPSVPLLALFTESIRLHSFDFQDHPWKVCNQKQSFPGMPQQITLNHQWTSRIFSSAISWS